MPEPKGGVNNTGRLDLSPTSQKTSSQPPPRLLKKEKVTCITLAHGGGGGGGGRDSSTDGLNQMVWHFGKLASTGHLRPRISRCHHFCGLYFFCLCSVWGLILILFIFVLFSGPKERKDGWRIRSDCCKSTPLLHNRNDSNHSKSCFTIELFIL